MRALLDSRRRSHALRMVLAAIGASAAGFAAASCEEELPTSTPDEPVAEVEITVQYPDEPTESIIASLHLWVVTVEEDASSTCNLLVGGLSEPYEVDGSTVGDAVAANATGPLLAANVPVGNAVAYVEASDFYGRTELAGCVAIEVQEPKTSATLTLGKAKVFDCSDPSTPDGSPCDDGEICMVGEVCSGGQCGGAIARDCTHLADSCNAATCDDELGCVVTPLADATPCDDGLYCTEGDICESGVCVGAPLDCATDAPDCQEAVGCDELEGCLYDDVPNGTLCDDGVFCTDGDTCQFGFCDPGNTMDCSDLTTSCATGTCDEDLDACVAAPRPPGTFCNDSLYCTLSDSCDGAGNCTGTPRTCAGGTTCMPNVCNEALDSCQPMAASNTTACNDSNACTDNDLCNGSGTCVGMPIPNCP